MGKRPFFELGVMLHGQAALNKCHCFEIVRAKRDETMKEMRKGALGKLNFDGTLSPWGPPTISPSPGPGLALGPLPGQPSPFVLKFTVG